MCEGMSAHGTSSSTRRAEKNSSDKMTARRKTLESTRFDTTTCRVHAPWTTCVTKQHMCHETRVFSEGTKRVLLRNQACPLHEPSVSSYFPQTSVCTHCRLAAAAHRASGEGKKTGERAREGGAKGKKRGGRKTYG